LKYFCTHKCCLSAVTFGSTSILKQSPAQIMPIGYSHKLHNSYYVNTWFLTKVK